MLGEFFRLRECVERFVLTSKRVYGSLKRKGVT